MRNPRESNTLKEGKLYLAATARRAAVLSFLAGWLSPSGHSTRRRSRQKAAHREEARFTKRRVISSAVKVGAIEF